MADRPTVNPYQSPDIAANDATPLSDARHKALWQIRAALLMLVLPALFNLILFHVAFARVPLFALVNLLGLLLTGLTIWLLGLKILEGVAVLLHYWFGGDALLEDWLAGMRESLGLLPWVAPLAAVCWFVWVYLNYIYYDLNAPLWLSPCFVFLGNVLGAAIYGTIFWKWYQLRQQSAG